VKDRKAMGVKQRRKGKTVVQAQVATACRSDCEVKAAGKPGGT